MPITQPKWKPNKQQCRLITKAVKKTPDFDGPCWNNWEDAFRVMGRELVFWYNGKNQSTHIVKERLN